MELSLVEKKSCKKREGREATSSAFAIGSLKKRERRVVELSHGGEFV